MSQRELGQYILGGAILTAVMLFAGLCIFKTVDTLIKPLRLLNSRMQDVMDAKPLGDLPENPDGKSIEINNLYNLFKSLISNKKFSNNNFLAMPDVLAVIDLAQACNMFDGTNEKAAGVCYNNIANLQIKNGKFSLAAENYFHSIQLADSLLNDTFLKREAFYIDYQRLVQMRDVKEQPAGRYQRYYLKVRAHRVY